jgi:hypothetical protein
LVEEKNMQDDASSGGAETILAEDELFLERG